MDSECENKKERKKHKKQKTVVFLAFLRLVLTPPFQKSLAEDRNQPAPVGPES